MHIHLDAIGGVAGDMFVAAMLDAFPALEAPLLQALKALPLQTPVMIASQAGEDAGISGRRFQVRLAADVVKADHHDHHHWRTIRHWLAQNVCEPEVKAQALGIFTQLAQAEAKIHAADVEDVCFHEVGAWDCIIDIVAASWLIVHSGARTWSVSALPWGGGTVRCAHGIIPVPAPATLELLRGFAFQDDGESGERVTPTGAAILAWLKPETRPLAGNVHSVGYGFGNRKLKRRANALRVTALENHWQQDLLTVMQCDIDDMSGELLAIARENLRALPGVLEVTESVAHGKKNRFINTLTLLCQPAQVQAIMQALFSQTTTLGVRSWPCQRTSLPRQAQEVKHQGQSFQVKTAQRPGNITTCKLEADNLTDPRLTQQQRTELKSVIEQQALYERDNAKD